MKRVFAAVFALFLVQLVSAQNDTVLSLGFDVRMDYEHEFIKKESIPDKSGFRIPYLNFYLGGNIIPNLSYSFHHRLSKETTKNFLAATDWIYIKYQLKKWDFTAGKQVVAIGGFEYDRAPIDLYVTSEFWNNVPCYRFGVSVGFSPSPNDRIMFQFSESPFRKQGEDTYGYSLIWYGNHKWFRSIYSVNMFEHHKGKFINYISLGNQFTFGDFRIQLDYMNRATSFDTFFQDLSAMGEIAYTPHEKWNIFLKGTFCMNHTDIVADYCVLPGTEITRLGGGVEFYPLPKGNKNLRIHLVASHALGENGNPDGTVLPDQTYINCGVKWNMNLLSLKRKKK